MKNDYFDDFKSLSHNFDLNTDHCIVEINGHHPFELQTFPFASTAEYVYPEAGDYNSKGRTFTSLLKYYIENNQYSNDLVFGKLKKTDRQIIENIRFRIPVFKPSGKNSFHRATFLLHGLNEKYWVKYLPWALRLMEETGAPVILFPIAFHMNRTPPSWGNPREMVKVAEERKKLMNDDRTTTFLNAALSHRIQFAPHRFFSSGMQTYYDIIRFVNEVRMGAHPYLDRTCRFDFFSYSIGATLTEVLLTTNQNSLLDGSKAFLFCGGAALDTSHPVSRTIIDNEAYKELFGWFATLFDSVASIGRKVKEIFFQDLPEVLHFKSFLFYDRMQQYRESSLKRNSKLFRSLGLKKDSVFPPEAINATLKGFSGNIKIVTDMLDFPFQYRHEEPFPLLRDYRAEVNESFDTIFTFASDYFNKSA